MKQLSHSLLILLYIFTTFPSLNFEISKEKKGKGKLEKTEKSHETILLISLSLFSHLAFCTIQ